jgi:signal transduction histidine kinase
LALFADCTSSVLGDAVELREVLVNMIYNAVDAMPSGGEIRMSAQEVDGRVVLNISDTGAGMTPEVKSRLFDPFFTTKGKDGTGMGMAVSFGIIRRHNGRLTSKAKLAGGRVPSLVAAGFPGGGFRVEIIHTRRCKHD